MIKHKLSNQSQWLIFIIFLINIFALTYCTIHLFRLIELETFKGSIKEHYWLFSILFVSTLYCLVTLFFIKKNQLFTENPHKQSQRRLLLIIAIVANISSLYLISSVFIISAVKDVSELLFLMIALIMTSSLVATAYKQHNVNNRRQVLQKVLNNMSDALVVINHKGIIVEYSKTAEITFGYETSEIIGRNIYVLFPFLRSEIKKAHDENSLTKIEKLLSKIKENRVEHKFKHEIDISLNITAFSLHHQKYLCLICRDITLDKLTLKAIQESEERLLKAQELTHLGSWEWHVKKDQLYWSKEMYNLWGVAVNTPASYDTFFSRLHPDDQQPVQQHVEQALKGGKYSVEYRVCTDDGIERHIYAEGEVIFDESGEPDTFFGTAQDITEQKTYIHQIEDYQKELESLLDEKTIQLKKADAANEAKSRFLANISHELRTPLNGIIATLDLLDHSPLNKQQQRWAKIGQTTADSFLSLINEVLDYSKIEANEIKLDIVEFNINTLIQDAVNSLTILAKAKNIQINCFLAPDLPESIICDPHKIKQILFNLLNNAIKFTGNENSKGLIELDVACKDEQLILAIKDNGIGINSKQIPYLFQPFTQADATTSRKFGGTGLGLSIVNGILKLLSGEITCESQLGRGTNFYLTIPSKIGKPNEAQSEYHYGKVLLIGSSTKVNIAIEKELSFNGANVCKLDVSNIFDLNQALLEDSQYIIYTGESPLEIAKKIPIDKFFWLSPQKPISESYTHTIETNPFFSNSIHEYLQPMQDTNLDKEVITKNMSSFENQILGELKILLVEDNLHNQEVIQYQLDKIGFSFLLADDGKHAIKQLESHAIDLVITDCHMPELDGYQLTNLIRMGKLNVSKELPIIGLTGDATHTGLELCHKVGMNKVIFKPAKIGDIKNAIEEILNLIQTDINEGQKTNELEIDMDLTSLSDDVAFQYLNDDIEVIQSFRKSFIEKNRQSVENLAEAIINNDIKFIQHLAHKMKSSSLFIGAMKLNHLCQNLEDLSSNPINQKNTLSILINTLIKEFRKIETTVNQQKTDIDTNED